VFEPRRPRATVVVHGATAVPHGYYGAFAEALATRGLRVVTYDYRGVGASRPATLRGFDATMTQWAELDARAVQIWAGRDASFVGHSFGGQIIGLVDELRAARGAVLVASPLAWYGWWPLAQRPKMMLQMFAMLPVLVRAYGYLPGRFGLGEDLPAGVALEWARWCRSKDYLISTRPDAAARFARFDRPTRAYTIAGDAIAPPRAVEALTRRLGNVDRVRVDEPYGHFGFFRPKASAHWGAIVDFLLAPHVEPCLTIEEIEDDLRYGRT
jgi:predicted alpha/beta hydrolase